MKSTDFQGSSYPVWHPFTQMAEFTDPVTIVSGKGSYLVDSKGRRYLDGNSSLWVNLHGHRHPVITRAVKAQLDRIAHSTLLGLANEPSTKLAKELVRLAPRGLTRVFFSDNGATAVEVAMKMAFQYWRHRGRPEKQKFLHMADSYHGDTLGAVSVGGVPLFHDTFRPLLFKTYTVPSYHCARCPWNGERLTSEARFHGSTAWAAKRGRCQWECVGKVEEALKVHHRKIAAVIIEPKVQGAAGMLTAPAGYLKKLRALCTRYGVLLIMDEVAVGFGRTGRMFACEHEGVRPDFLCLAKGLTGGYVPMAATLTTEKIFEAFLGRYEEFKTFFHGHSYAGNQVGAAAALASLKVFKDEKLLEALKAKIALFRTLLKPIAALPQVGDVRQCGMIAAVELMGSERTGHRLCLALRKDGVILRPLGNVIPLVPPLSISHKELEVLCRALSHRINLMVPRHGM